MPNLSILLSVVSSLPYSYMMSLRKLLKILLDIVSWISLVNFSESEVNDVMLMIDDVMFIFCIGAPYDT